MGWGGAGLGMGRERELCRSRQTTGGENRIGEIKAHMSRCGMLGRRYSSKCKQIQILAAAALHREPGILSVLKALQLYRHDCSKAKIKIAPKDTFVPDSLTWLD